MDARIVIGTFKTSTFGVANAVSGAQDFVNGDYQGAQDELTGAFLGLTALRSGLQTVGPDKWSRVPQTLQDQMTLEAAKKGAGTKIIDSLNDPKFKGMEKWEYRVKSSEGRDSVVHYVRDPDTGELMDFKFTKHSNDMPTVRERTPEPSVSSGKRP